MHRKVVWALLSLPAAVLAVGSAGERIVVVADSRGYPGWAAWFINLYNESHLLFAILTVVTIPASALILGRITSWAMARTGINLKSRELAEH